MKNNKYPYKGFISPSSSQFWKTDSVYLNNKRGKGNLTLRYWVLNNVVYTNNGPSIIKAVDCYRYKDYKDIIDAAISDLKNKEDGVWYFSEKDGWYSKPITDLINLYHYLVI